MKTERANAEMLKRYLEELREALTGADPALAQDALADTEAHLRMALEAAKEADPQEDEGAALERVLASFGTPAEVSEAWRTTEATVQKALKAPPAPQASVPFFGILWNLKAYTSLFYMLTSIVTGIFAFTWVSTGLSLSVGLAVLIIGVPFFLFLMTTTRVLALAEGRLVEAMLDVRMPRRARLMPQGDGLFAKAKALLKDRTTWLSLLYLALKLPIGLITFTVFTVLLSLTGGFIAAPFGHWIFGIPVVNSWEGHEFAVGTPGLILMLLLGLLGFVVVLHLARGAGKLLGSLAKLMLVPQA